MKTIIERGASWTLEETKLLLRLWGKDLVERQSTGAKRTKEVYERIADKFNECGHERTADQVRTRIFNMIAEYRRILKDNNPERERKCIFFAALHKIYQARHMEDVKSALDDYEPEYDSSFRSEPTPIYCSETGLLEGEESEGEDSEATDGNDSITSTIPNASSNSTQTTNDSATANQSTTTATATTATTTTSNKNNAKADSNKDGDSNNNNNETESSGNTSQHHDHHHNQRHHHNQQESGTNPTPAKKVKLETPKASTNQSATTSSSTHNSHSEQANSTNSTTKQNKTSSSSTSSSAIKTSATTSNAGVASGGTPAQSQPTSSSLPTLATASTSASSSSAQRHQSLLLPHATAATSSSSTTPASTPINKLTTPGSNNTPSYININSTKLPIIRTNQLIGHSNGNESINLNGTATRLPTTAAISHQLYQAPVNTFDVTSSALLIDRMFAHLSRESENMREWIALEKERLALERTRRQQETEREVRRERVLIDTLMRFQEQWLSFLTRLDPRIVENSTEHPPELRIPAKENSSTETSQSSGSNSTNHPEPSK